jgi:hypothetical protein
MGLDPAGLVITYQHCQILSGFCFLFIVLSPLVNCLPDKIPLMEQKPRLKVWLKRTCGNCTAFGILYNIEWVMRLLKFSGPSGAMVAALGATLTTYVLVFVLDWVADAECSPPVVDKEVRFYIEPLSLLIGLTWKQAFIVSIKVLETQIDVLPRPVEILIIAVVVAMIIVPAWRMYIVPVVMHPEWHEQWRSMVELPQDGNYEHAGSPRPRPGAQMVQLGNSDMIVPRGARVMMVLEL